MLLTVVDQKGKERKRSILEKDAQALGIFKDEHYID